MSFYQLVIEQKTSTTIRWAESGTRPKMCDIGVRQISDINIIPSLFRKNMPVDPIVMSVAAQKTEPIIDT